MSMVKVAIDARWSNGSCRKMLATRKRGCRVALEAQHRHQVKGKPGDGQTKRRADRETGEPRDGFAYLNWHLFRNLYLL